MKHPIILSLMLVSLTAVTAQVSQAENIHLLGAGVNYLQTLGDIKDAEDFDEDSLSFIASYQFQTGNLLKLELDLEMVLDYGGSDEILWQPQGYALIGTWIYAGAGIGWGYLDGTWFNVRLKRSGDASANALSTSAWFVTASSTPTTCSFAPRTSM